MRKRRAHFELRFRSRHRSPVNFDLGHHVTLGQNYLHARSALVTREISGGVGESARIYEAGCARNLCAHPPQRTRRVGRAQTKALHFELSRIADFGVRRRLVTDRGLGRVRENPFLFNVFLLSRIRPKSEFNKTKKTKSKSPRCFRKPGCPIISREIIKIQNS